MRAQRSLTVAVFVSAMVAPAAGRADDTVTVAASPIMRTLPATFHGIDYVGFWDTAQGSAASQAALSRTATAMVRFPGGDPGDWYDWQCPFWDGTTCPASATASSWSSTSPLDLWNYAHAIGGMAMFQTNFQGNLPNPPGQSYPVNSAQNAGAWASYAQAQGMSVLFEIGNEEDINMTSTHDANFQPYIDAFKAQAQAIHAAAPGTAVVGPAGTNEYFWWALDSLGMFLAATGNRGGDGSADGVSLHFYRGSSWSDSVGTAQYWQGSGGPWPFIASTIAAHDSRALPVYVSEWHVGPSTTDFNASMQNALLTADLIGAFAQSGVAGHQYFTTHGVDSNPSYGALYGAGESRPTDSPTPTYYALVLWGLMGDQVLGLTQSADPSQTVSTYATSRADGSLQVMAINKSTSATTVAISFTGFDPGGRTVDLYTLSPNGAATSKDALYNGATNPAPSALPAPATSTAPGATFSTSVPASSIVVAAFRGNGTVTTGAGGATGGGGGATGAGGATGGGGASGHGGAAATGASGGCGCRTAQAPLSSLVLALLSAGILMPRRRGRRSSRYSR
jgi:hypothetical protein